MSTKTDEQRAKWARAEWRDTYSAHDVCWDDETIDVAEVRKEIRNAIAAVKDAAGGLPNRETRWDIIDDGDLNDLAHVLANLNTVLLHLDDVTGC